MSILLVVAGQRLKAPSSRLKPRPSTSSSQTVYKDVDALHKAGHDGDAMAVPSFMQIAIEEARAAAARGEVPVGCAIVRSGTVIARAGNRTIADRDPTAHAELVAIRAASAALGSERLADCDLYVTLEPCAMCATAMSFARIRRLYFGAADPKGGAVEHGVRFFASPTCHHRPEVYGGINESECAALLKDFFQARRSI
jgi:tRNA(adenine34) deaminase